MANNPLYKKLLERLMMDRPDLAQYADVLQQFEEQEDDSSQVEEKIKQLELRLRKASSVVMRLKGDLNDALDALEDIARALGACHECWGEDKHCPVCHGYGQPGFTEPDRALFNRFVLPALQKASWLEVTVKQQI